jgi:hypothetical protein
MTSISAEAAAYARQLERNKLYKQHRRQVDESYRESEKKSRRKWAKRRYERFKLAEAFMLDNPSIFQQWCKENFI